MSTRDELANLLEAELADRGQYVEKWPDDEKALFRDLDAWTDFTDRESKLHRLRFEKAAKAVRAAGYSRSRVVETIEELRALPEGSVVMWDDKYGGRVAAVIEDDEGFIGHTAHDYWNSEIKRIGLPATVLHLPEETP